MHGETPGMRVSDCGRTELVANGPDKRRKLYRQDFILTCVTNVWKIRDAAYGQCVGIGCRRDSWRPSNMNGHAADVTRSYALVRIAVGRARASIASSRRSRRSYFASRR